MPVTPYDPRHAAKPAGPAQSRPARAPAGGRTGLTARVAAFAHAHPVPVRRLAIGAIGAGVALFVVTSVASAATGTHPSRPGVAAAGAPLAAGGGPAVPSIAAPSSSSSAPAAEVARNARAASDRPVRSHVKAPATKQVITGLAANGIPNVALNAYRVAAARMAHVLPSCGIDWPMLAGIGREESDHGRFAGAVLHPDGTSTPRIIGPALDGTNSDYIAAPADGFALDGDSVYTHALGPMQFIPQTWAAYGADANGDGIADIFNINDAALGAARYLCANGGNLRTQAGRIAAVLAYNHNDEYLAQVLALAQAYRTGVPVSGVPQGILTGALPPVHAGGLLGVNPGAPTAVGALSSGSSKRGGGSSSAAKPGGRAGTSSGTHSGTTSGTRSGTQSGSRSGTQSGSQSGTQSGSGSPSHPSSGPTSSGAPVVGGVTSSPTGGSSGSTGNGGSGGSSDPTPTPTPTPTCRLGVAGTCIVP
jgi:membrane-bound lytic murein transglycosylase B